MKNEIIEILKTKEAEMDEMINQAKIQASELMTDAEKKYKVTKDNILSNLSGEIEKLQQTEEKKLQTKISELKALNEKDTAKVQTSFEKNKTKAIEHVINRIMEEIIDQKDVKTSDRGA